MILPCYVKTLYFYHCIHSLIFYVLCCELLYIYLTNYLFTIYVMLLLLIALAATQQESVLVGMKPMTAPDSVIPIPTSVGPGHSSSSGK